jgi:hypothetical protein
VSSVEEAVTILLFTFHMRVEAWHRDTIVGGRLAHTVFFTRK